ncbi:MAG TPA: hydantoinase/oxoprolinase family protein [Bauldia sp.]|nr:hydantoinase/oxoprolinase family protein [Bauldia sp.]
MVPGYRLGVDIGGTFTDMVLVSDDGAVHTLKILSSPPDFGRAVINGLTQLLEMAEIAPTAVRDILHGTTVATNAILEMRGANTGLVTSTGFRDVLELGRMRHPSLYDMTWQKPLPLVPRRLRMELDFRLDAAGAVLREAQAGEIDTVAGQLRAAGVEAVAVCFINSHANPDAERKVAAALRAALPGISVSVSAEILPEIKEYERTSTTVVNAYVQPIVDRYLADLEGGIRASGVTGGFRIMQSSGGLIEAEEARARPVQMIESGPAAGVIAVRALAHRIGRQNVVSFDMGGTTAKASLIEDGEPFEAAEYEVGGGMNTGHGLTRGGGYTIRVPSIDISEVGAGGGSICWVDTGGGARVGPRSASADPGPACYGRGGTAPTLTDANVVLGYLSPHFIAGGSQRIEPELARKALADHFAGPLGLGLLEGAFGAYRIAVAAMSKAIRAVTSQRGRDPRDFALVAFGGAGPMYGAAMATEFEIETVIVPPRPGLFSAIGLLVADIQHHAVMSLARRQAIDASDLTERFERMEKDLRGRFTGGDASAVVVERFADMRYRGQSSELRIPVPDGRLDENSIREMHARFDSEHERTFGHRGSQHAPETLNIRVRARSAADARRGGSALAHHTADGETSLPAREAYFGPTAGSMETPVLTRAALTGGRRAGPFIVEEMDSTTLVPPGWNVSLDGYGNLIMEAA